MILSFDKRLSTSFNHLVFSNDLTIITGLLELLLKALSYVRTFIIILHVKRPTLASPHFMCQVGVILGLPYPRITLFQFMNLET